MTPEIRLVQLMTFLMVTCSEPERQACLRDREFINAMNDLSIEVVEHLGNAIRQRVQTAVVCN